MDKNVKPAISVLMPVYNGEKYLKQAIDSILSQTFTNFELITINDGSKDSSLDILKSYNDPRLIIINNEINKGLIESLNIGLAQCKGVYTARFDHDDVALPHRLEIQYNFMQKHPEIDLVGGWTECIDSNNKSLKINRNPSNPIVIRYEFLFNNVMFHSSIFFRTEKIKKKGGYSEEFVHSEDYEMYSRPGKELICSNIPEVLFKLRLHSDSITGSVNSQPTVHMNALNVTYRNINQYISLSREDFDRIKIVLIIKKPSPKITFGTLLLAKKVLKNATIEFTKKNNLSLDDKILIQKSYSGRNKMMWQHYLIGRYRAIFKKNE